MKNTMDKVKKELRYYMSCKNREQVKWEHANIDSALCQAIRLKIWPDDGSFDEEAAFMFQRWWGDQLCLIRDFFLPIIDELEACGYMPKLKPIENIEEYSCQEVRREIWGDDGSVNEEEVDAFLKMLYEQPDEVNDVYKPILNELRNCGILP